MTLGSRESFIITISERENATAIKQSRWIRRIGAKETKSNFLERRGQRQWWMLG